MTATVCNPMAAAAAGTSAAGVDIRSTLRHCEVSALDYQSNTRDAHLRQGGLRTGSKNIMS